MSSRFDGRWWVVHTKARNEKAFARDLARRSIGCFLPLARVEKRYGGRRVRSQIPLFPGYVFMRGGEEDRLAALQTHRTAGVLEVADQVGLRAALVRIQHIVDSGEPVDLYPGIRRGLRCRITDGPLRGLEGTVLRRKGVCRVFIAVEVLGQSAETEVDGSAIEICS